MMKNHGKPITILLVDDDPDDRMLVRNGLSEYRLANNLQTVEDGEEMMDYLYHRGKYTDPVEYPRPGLILLDLNMPKKDGREALMEMKSDSTLRQIPVIILTTSKAEEDVFRSYDLGANSFITKPVTFGALVDLMKVLGTYWFEIVELPAIKVGS